MKLLVPSIAGVSLSVVVVGGYLLYQSWQAAHLLETSTPEGLTSQSKEQGKAHEASSHSAKNAEQGEGAAAEGGHAPPEGGHGAATADAGGGEHGGSEAGGGGHGEGKGDLAGVGNEMLSSSATPIVTLAEAFINVNSPESDHFMRLKVELELFESDYRALVLKNKAGLQNAMIEISRAQTYSRLNTLAGKLSFKEELVSQFNEFLNQPAIRDVHFADFYLQ